MRRALVLIAALGLAACSPGYKTVDYPLLPAELKDCKFYQVSNSSGNNINVVRCPSSQTSTTWTQSSGKTSSTHTTVTIDGAEYQKVEK